MRIKFFLWVSLVILFSACSFDLGYVPSDMYDNTPVQYSVYASYQLPKCNGEMEGYVFYVSDKKEIYACVEGSWTIRPNRRINTDELEDIEVYSKDSFRQRKSSSSRSSSSNYRSSSSSYDDWDDDWDDNWGDDDWEDDNWGDDDYNYDPYNQKSSCSSSAISSSSSLSSSNIASSESSNAGPQNPFESGDFTLSTIEAWLADTAAVEAWLEEASMVNPTLGGDFNFKTTLNYKKDEARISIGPAIDIGKQRWTVTNTDSFKKGIASITGEAASSCTAEDPCVYYENTDDALCPYGYHVPSEDEWMELINFTGGMDVAGKHLKATDFSDDPEHIGMNTFGFTAQPLGFIEFLNDSDNPTATLTPNVAAFWTREGSIVYIYSDKDNIEIAKSATSNNYYSIRCVKEIQ